MIDIIKEAIRMELKTTTNLDYCDAYDNYYNCYAVLLAEYNEIDIFCSHVLETEKNRINDRTLFRLFRRNEIFKTILKFCEHERDNITSLNSEELEDVILSYSIDFNKLMKGDDIENKKLNIYQCYITHTAIFILINGMLIFYSTNDKI